MKSFNLDKILDSVEIEILLLDKEEFEVDLRFTSKLKENYSTFEKEIKSFSEIKILNWRDLPNQGIKLGLPSRISFNRDFVFKIRPGLKKIKTSFEEAKSAGKEINIESYMAKNFSICKKYHKDLSDSVAIASYIILNRDKIRGLYPRQISHGKSTKLLLDIPIVKGILVNYYPDIADNGVDIFDYFDLRRKPVPFHFFATKVDIRGNQITNFFGAINEINKGDFKFNCKNTIIVENEESFISLAESVKDSLVIFGAGWKVAALSSLRSEFPGEIFYWGDLDHEGIEILNHVSIFIPNLIPLAMDANVLSVFSSLIQDDSIKKPSRNVKLLLGIYNNICNEGKRIEQEQIPVEYVLSELEKLSQG